MAESLELVPFRRLIDDVLSAVKAHWASFAPSLALPLVVLGLLTLVMQHYQLEMSTTTDPSAAFGSMGMMFAVLFVVMVGYALVYNVALVAAVNTVETGRPELGRAWFFVLRPDILFYQAVVWICIFVSMMMCLAPVLLVGPLLILVIPILYHERLGLPAAIERNIHLARFNPTGRMRDSGWLQLVATMVLGGALSYAVSFVVQLPFAIVQMFVLFRQGAFDSGMTDPAAMVSPLWLQLPMIVTSALATAFTWLYWVFVLATLYREMRRRQEGDDLQEAIDTLTGRTTEALPMSGATAP